MAERSDRIIHPITQVLARLSRSEQLEVMQTHPLFTGKCPCCGSRVPHHSLPPARWDCHDCGWEDDALEAAS
uniref:Uncharacterized protein n=1 Tax=Cyanothece sp. (strain PCC 7425 / ATCC 29141) TaxID=395961 RepID=B8HWA2_CYAP4